MQDSGNMPERKVPATGPDLFNAVQFSKSQLEAIFDHLEPMCMLNRDFVIVRLNKAMADFLGKTYRECLGKDLHEIFRDLDHQLLVSKSDLVFSASRPIQVHDHPMMEKGRKGWFEITFYPIIDKNRLVKECVIYFKNITELFLTKRILLEQYKRLEEQQMMVENKNTLLIETQKSLDKAYKSLMDELSVAQEVQRGIMPSNLPRIPGLNFFASYEPISQVGGDVYDFIDLGHDKIGVFIADVSGHGLAPAFVGAMVKMSLIDHAFTVQSPRRMFSIMNRNLLRHLNSGHYLTAFYGIIDLSDNSFEFSKASHPNPILIRKNGDIHELETGGMFLGLIDEPGYEEKRITLEKGDRIYMFTDGYYELKCMDGRQYTYPRLKEMIREVNHLPEREALQQIQANLRQLAGEGELEDDRTFLILEVTGEGREAYKPLLQHFSDQETVVIRQYSTEGDFEFVFNELEDYLREKVDSEDVRRRISLCAIELSNNAMEHGNGGDPAKTIQLAYTVSSGKLKLAIRDEGEGFRPRAVEDPRVGDNWRRERGRGIFIVRSYMDEVYFNEKGNMVTVILNLNPGGT